MLKCKRWRAFLLHLAPIGMGAPTLLDVNFAKQEVKLPEKLLCNRNLAVASLYSLSVSAAAPRYCQGVWGQGSRAESIQQPGQRTHLPWEVRHLC